MPKVIKIRGHHIPSIFEYYKLKQSGSKKDPFFKLRTHGYTQAYIDNKQRICELLCNNPTQEVKIINTLDVLCNSCDLKKKSCSNLLCTDVLVADKYGLVCGATYTARQFFSYVKR